MENKIGLRALGKSNLMVTPIGLGCWQFSKQNNLAGKFWPFLEDELIQEGIVNQAVVYPRKVLENALKRKASAIILLHNHPSGHIRPSDADIRLTRTIQETAKVLDILVHDHIIIGENRFFSFREEGIMS